MSGTTAQTLPVRAEVPDAFKWRLEDIYPDQEAWEREFRDLKALLPELAAFQGRLGSASALLDALTTQERAQLMIDRLYSYAGMHKDEDNADSAYHALADRAESLAVQLGSATSFIVPEILALAPETIAAWSRELPALQKFAHYLDDIVRVREHVLPAPEERILAMAGEVESAPHSIFTMLNNADLEFGEVIDEHGRAVQLTHGRYTQFLESGDRRVRREAFKKLYAQYGAHKNTLAATLGGSVKTDVFNARVRKYPSALAASLDARNIPVSVYDTLIQTVHGRLDLLHRYLKLRKRVLGVDQLHMYDLYVPIVPEVRVTIPWEEAKATVLDALHPLGPAYVDRLRQGFDSGWIDVLENKGKTSGAYSSGLYGVHPYVLLNYQENLDNVFTLAHEMGHALHSYYANEAQPYVDAGYTIFVAEVASTFNEALLTHYLLGTERDPQKRLYILNRQLETFRGTLYRQTMFAEFERWTHDTVETGGVLTVEGLCRTYRDLNRTYFGDDVVIDPEIELEWARIPHFYTAFYVYQYATGISAAQALAQQVLAEGAPAVERYLGMLRRGGSAYSIELLKDAGVDMTTSAPINQAHDVFAGTLAEMERAL